MFDCFTTFSDDQTYFVSRYVHLEHSTTSAAPGGISSSSSGRFLSLCRFLSLYRTFDLFSSTGGFDLFNWGFWALFLGFLSFPLTTGGFFRDWSFNFYRTFGLFGSRSSPCGRSFLASAGLSAFVSSGLLIFSISSLRATSGPRTVSGSETWTYS